MPDLEHPGYEQAVISSMLLDADYAIPIASAMVEPEDFTVRGHQLIFETLVALQEKNIPVDLATVVEHLKHAGRLAEVGGAYAVCCLFEALSTSRNIEYHARKVREAALRRRLAIKTQVAADLAQDPNEDLAAILAGLSDGLNDMKVSTTKDRASDYLAEFIEDMERGTRKPIQTGFIGVDTITGGMEPGDLIILAGRPGTGKTSFALDVLRRLSVDMPTGFISLEMPCKHIVRRMACAETGVPISRTRSDVTDPALWEKICNSAKAPWVNRLRMTSEATSLAEIRRVITSWATSEHVKVVVIDYLQLIGHEEKENRNREISDISRTLKRLAVSLDIVVVALSQLSRATEGRSEGKPRLADLRDSGAIEQDADQVLMLWRKADYVEGATREDMMMLVEKNRNGNTGQCALTFLPHLSSFRTAL